MHTNYTEQEIMSGAIQVYAAFVAAKGHTHPHAMNLRQWIISAFGVPGSNALVNFEREQSDATAPVDATAKPGKMRSFVHPNKPGKQTPAPLKVVAGSIPAAFDPSQQPHGENPESRVAVDTFNGGAFVEPPSGLDGKWIEPTATGLSDVDRAEAEELKRIFGDAATAPATEGETFAEQLANDVKPLTDEDIKAIGAAKSATWVADNYWPDQLKPFVVAKGGNVTDKTSHKQLAQMAIIAAGKK